MRPPVTATPPVSHMIPQRRKYSDDVMKKTQRRSADVTMGLRLPDADVSWAVLTADNSIQIIHLDSDNSHVPICASATVDDSEIFTSQTSSSDKLNNRLKEVSSDQFTDLVQDHNDIKRLFRNCYSDSDVYRINTTLRSKVNAVSRSKSVNYADVRPNNECRLLQPLLPRANNVKVGNIKRIPSFREKMKDVNEGEGQCIRKDTANIVHSRRSSNKVRYAESCRVAGSENHRAKIAKLVKQGIKSLTKAKDSFEVKSVRECSGTAGSSRTEFKKERRARSRRGNTSIDIGGLSEFLRKNERCKTLVSFSDFKTPGTLETVAEDVRADSELKNDEQVGREYIMSKFHSNVKQELTYTPKPWTSSLESLMARSTGTTNLKQSKCQRQLKFEGQPKAETHDLKTDETIDNFHLQGHERLCPPLQHLNGHQTPAQLSENTTRPPCPSLGLLCKSKPVTILPIDDLERDLVRDLKRRIEKANQVSRIKTNGSLKMKLGSTHLHKMSTHRSPRNLNAKASRHTPPCAFLQVYTKRESFV